MQGGGGVVVVVAVVDVIVRVACRGGCGDRRVIVDDRGRRDHFVLRHGFRRGLALLDRTVGLENLTRGNAIRCRGRRRVQAGVRR